ncbi:MAG: tyrosine-type recombinase/integrase [Burkholderiales bacterium]
MKVSTSRQYLEWIARFRIYCTQRHLTERRELTWVGGRRFIRSYARRRHLDAHSSCVDANKALYALTRVYQVLGRELPRWKEATPARPPAMPLLRAYAAYLVQYRGNPQVTVHKKLKHAGQLLGYLRKQGLGWRAMKLTDIDGFLIESARHFARTTTAGIACSTRAFTRFLLATGRCTANLADSVIAPVQRKHERPRRAWPWEDVQRLLQSIDLSSSRGLRDHALLLLMGTYGFGAGEVIRLQLQDIDWVAATIHVVRPKTGVAFTLPLLPAVAQVLARYVRDGRPPRTPTRHLFVRMNMPFEPLSCSSPVRHILIKHAQAAGIKATYLGTHVLRYSNAARHMDLGAGPRVLSDLLGQSDPESVSAYIRIATERLREVSLPVPS